MKTRTLATLLAVILPTGWVWAGGEDTNREQQALRLELDLADGSHIIGIPGFGSVRVQTAYAKLDIPLKQILSLKMADDHETAAIELRNGDRVTGVAAIGDLELRTVFGTVTVGAEHLRQLRVAPAGMILPAALREGLAVRYAFDRDQAGKVTDLSDRKNHGRLQGAKWTPNGKAGGAYRFDGVSASIVTTEPIGIAGAAANTVCAWSKSANNDNMKCIWSMGNGHGGGENAHGPALHGDILGLHYGGIGDTLTARVDPSAWNFVCRTYDGTTQFLYVNGVLIGKESREMNLADHPLNIGRWKAGDDYSYYFDGFIDEVMVFTRALSADDIRTLYESLK